VSIEQRERVWARDYLTDRVKLLPHRSPKISSTFILEHVAFMHNLSAEQILATRQKPRVIARHVAMYLAREITDESSTQIARAFRKRDHTTILYGTRRISDRIAIEPRFAQEVELLRRLITESFAAYCTAFAQQRAS
jgi:chromosomal replication initiator protein